MTRDPAAPLRSVLYVPASNPKALAKIGTLAADAVILDLEDAVAPEEKAAARERLCAFFAAKPDQPALLVIRINALNSEWGSSDLEAVKACRPDAVLLPKVDTPRDILAADDALDEIDASKRIGVWAMIETPKAMLNIGAIAALGRDRAARLGCFVAGTNDLAKDTGIRMTPDRRYLVPALSQMVMAARAGSLAVLDGVSNDFRDLDAFAAECREARNMGFDGKTLIHPAQIASTNAIFAPNPKELAEAQAIVDAFADQPGKGVIQINGRMVERLHLAQAERLLAGDKEGNEQP
ncbi:HpcH/HpaI aldolase/citrate lyase family protein [Tianweitania sediminis]|uniref:CoA ester lyase n=1 Tax=Tianweitania sediminis TaxID=1502156 RepID=A0A8J7RFL2_9HYPH|nr:CoA ester lyase [Tianweitania sediminis]MBP0437546.1 CoA ester lyase [Tianweitania sediminis]